MAKSKEKNKITARNKHLSFSLSEKEHAFILAYIEKYQLENRSRWLRETILSHILQKLDQDYPTLFGENEMRR